MFASAPGAPQRKNLPAREPSGAERPRRMVALPPARTQGEAPCCSLVDLGDSTRLPLMLKPRSRGSFAEQAREILCQLEIQLQHYPKPMAVTWQTVFLRDAADRAQCERLMGAHFGAHLPVTNYVLQPPCSGAALALEAWAIGGPDVRFERFGQHALAVHYDGVRWVYCAGVETSGAGGAYAGTLQALERLSEVLRQAGSGFQQVVRTWFYLGDITGLDKGEQRYRELNRARTDFYRQVRFSNSNDGTGQGMFPASTGIGMGGTGLALGCVSFQTERQDARLVPLENPRQTPAYAYHARYSAQSPKFSRAMALVLGDYLTLWISGTASIVNSESRHPGDIVRQTEQTIDNIERLIATENLSSRGLPGMGANLSDIAKIRVYVKRPEDFAACKAVCERRFGPVPAMYAVADVCRPELLVEIEGIAFSRCQVALPERAAQKSPAARLADK